MDAQFQLVDGVLRVAGTLDLDSAEPLRDALLELLEQSAAPKIDLSGVAACDLAALQLIYSALRTGSGQGTRVSVSGAAGAISLACSQLGTSMEALLEGGH